MVFVGLDLMKQLSPEWLVLMGIPAGDAISIMKHIEVLKYTSPRLTKLLEYMKSTDPEQLVPSSSSDIRIADFDVEE